MDSRAILMGVLMVFLLGGTEPVYAADIAKADSSEGKTRINLTGQIAPGDAEKLAAVIKAANENGDVVSAILLNSPGGNISEAVKLADAVRFARMSTIVLERAVCASACFIILAAGNEKTVHHSARIGVHGASDTKGQETIEAGAATVSMARIVRRLGVPASIIGKMVVTPPDKMVWLTIDDLRDMGVTMAGKPMQSMPQQAQPDAPGSNPVQTRQTPSLSEPLDAATKQRSAELDKLIKTPRPSLASWTQCLLKFANTVSRDSNESAELIARATFAACKSRESAAYKALLDTTGITSDETTQRLWQKIAPEKLWPDLKKTQNDKIIAAVLVAKTKPQASVSGSKDGDAITQAVEAANRRDYPAVMRLMKPLAEQGNPNAQVMMAISHERGQPIDEAEAQKWYRRAAEQGNSQAQYMLGRYYARAQGGLTQDRVSAYMWLTLAVARGNQHASTELGAVEPKMTPEQISEANKRLREWKPARRP